MKFKDVMSLSDQDLQKRYDEISLELMKITAQVKRGTSPQSPGKVRELKRTIAKILTAKTQRGESVDK